MRNKMHVFWITIIAACLLATSWVYASRSYPLYCRKGGNMEVGLLQYKIGTKIGLRIAFKKDVANKFDYANPRLRPGYCSWRDRPMNSKEPYTMVHETDVKIDIRYYPGTNREPKVFPYNHSGVKHQQKYIDISRFFRTLRDEEYFSLDVYLDEKNQRFNINRFH